MLMLSAPLTSLFRYAMPPDDDAPCRFAMMLLPGFIMMHAAFHDADIFLQPAFQTCLPWFADTLHVDADVSSR